MTTTSTEDLSEQLGAALRHPNPHVRSGAAVALGRLKTVERVDALLEGLKDPVHVVRQSAGRALGMLGAPAVGVLLAELQENPDPEMQERLADTLAQIRDPEAVEMLAAALNYLEPPARYGAAEALGAIGDVRAVPALIQTTRSADAGSRQKAAHALLKIGAPEAAHALAALLDAADPRLRRLAVEGLGKIGGEQTVLTLVSALNDEAERVRWAAAEALMMVCAPGAEDILMTALNTSSTWVQGAVAAALGRYPVQPVRDRLHALAGEQGDLQTRLTAAQSLCILGDERGMNMILRTLNAPNTAARQLAALALGMCGDRRAIDPLIESIESEAMDPSAAQGRLLRRRTVRALANIGEPAIGPLIAAFSHSSALRRDMATETLMKMGLAVAGPLIETLSADIPIEARTHAAVLLGRIGHPAAIEPLSELLRETLMGPYPVVFFARLFLDRTAPLRAAAATALGAIDTQDGASLLLSAARFDPDPRVNQAAERALGRTGAPAIVARFARLDAAGFINRALASAAGLVLTAALAGAVSRLYGFPGAALLAGLAAGAVLGLADGLEGRKRPVRGALLGGLAALLLGRLLGWLDPPWLISLVGALLPATGALTGWGRLPLVQRLAGLFGGMVLGFIGGGIAALILGTIG